MSPSLSSKPLESFLFGFSYASGGPVREDCAALYSSSRGEGFRGIFTTGCTVRVLYSSIQALEVAQLRSLSEIGGTSRVPSTNGEGFA